MMLARRSSSQQKGFRFATFSGDTYGTNAKLFPTLRAAVKFNGTDAVDICNRKLMPTAILR